MKILIIENWHDRASGILDTLVNVKAVIRVVKPYIGEQLPRRPQDFDAIIISGGPMSVLDAGSKAENKFLLRVMHFVESAIAMDISVLGICLGHQIMASVMGGTVSKRGSLRIGSRKINIVSSIPDLPFTSFTSFVCHEDHVAVAPLNSTIVMSSNECRIESFILNSEISVLQGMQFHPEITSSKARCIIHVWQRQQNNNRKNIVPFDKFNSHSGKLVLHNFLSRVSDCLSRRKEDLIKL